MPDTTNNQIIWHKVLDDPKELPEGRVTTVNAGHVGICLSHYKGQFGALNNKCPHQGGPLGEGSIENGHLRCPWHGWDYDPITGKVPGYDDKVASYPIEIREDGIYVGLEEEPPHEQTVSDVMVETMINWGVDTVFGMVGHSNLGFADAMRRQEEKGNLKFYGIRHEGAAAFAASAYGKLTGRPAACFAIAGPGSTNLYTGLWDAKVDRAPILALTGQVNTQVIGTGAFQEVDLVQAFGSVADFNHKVLANSKHGELMSLAVKSAIVNREVSHLTFPDEVQEHPVGKRNRVGTPDDRMTPFTISPPKEMLDKALGMFTQAKRPAIIVGHGARFHMDSIIEFAEQLNAPVMTTFKGKGLIPDHHPLGCGVLGRSGTPIASWFMNEADLLCVFGASFSNHTGITPKIPTIQVDFDPMALSKFHKVDCAVWGEIGTTAQLFKDGLAGRTNTHDQRADVAKRWELWLAEKANRLKDESEIGLSSISIFDSMNKHVPSNAVMCVDVGNNAYSFGRYFEPKNQSFLMSGYLGSIGFAYPAAMGAWAAAPDRPVIAVAGDGGFGQYMGELMTAIKYSIPIKLILLNNNELGKISKEQRAAQLDVWQTDLTSCNFAKYAEACGMWNRRITDRSALDMGMQELIALDGPGVLEVITDPKLI